MAHAEMAVVAAMVGATSEDDLMKKLPNQAPEPTTLLVTIRAAARLAPSRVVAHL